jgi:hypothetical protein
MKRSAVCRGWCRSLKGDFVVTQLEAYAIDFREKHTTETSLRLLSLPRPTHWPGMAQMSRR